MLTLHSPERIKEREYSTSVIGSITVLQVLLQTLTNTKESVNALNVINPIYDPTGHDTQLNLTLKTQSQLIEILVQTLSVIIQDVLSLVEKYESNNFEMTLSSLNIAHEKMKASIGKILHLISADSEPSVWGTDASLLERIDVLEEIAKHLDAHVSRMEEHIVDM